MADSNWHYAQNDQTFGPVSFAALRDLAARNVLQRNTLVWTDGMNEWAAAETVPALWAGSPASVAASPGFIGYQTPAVNDFNYAGFWLRVLAFVIDWIITVIAASIVGGIAGLFIGFAMTAGHGNHSATATSTRVAGQVIGTIAGWLYYALMESSAHQATVGKMVLGLRVTDLNNERISFARATGRHFAKILSLLTLCIGYLMVGFTERKQGLHDMLAGTLVLRRSPQ